jgi:Protein NO VEIN, C-terminal
MAVKETILNSERITPRERLVLTGLYLSKYDSLGLKRLGFDNFIEAFNVIGYAMGSKPASIKNYRDEFDPFFPNPRKGWHKRPMRAYCRKVFEDYGGLDLETFSSLIKSFVGYDENIWSEVKEDGDKGEPSESGFAKRLITGLAAERYFEAVQPNLSEFADCAVENTTRLGCGYDFRLSSETREGFLAVEVKGLTERMGSLSLTPKEHEVATVLKERFFLFVVKNFREAPFHQIFQDPLAGGLQFRKIERVTIHVSWLTSV